MADIQTNCFTIVAGAPLQNGVPLQQGIDLTFLEQDPVVQVGERCRIWPRHGHHLDMSFHGNSVRRLERAQVTWARHGPGEPCLERPAHLWMGMIVHIKCNVLSFDIDPLIRGLNLWRGGDGDIIPFGQSGRHKYPDKEQIFQLENGQKILLVDQFAALSWMTCVDGTPVFTEVEVSELVEFLMSRAIAEKKPYAFDWALYNLDALARLRDANHGEIRNAIDTLNRKRAEAA